MQNQKLCLKWNRHMSNLLSHLRSFQKQDMLVDVTISCQGQNIKAHKVILSACSPYFQNIFMENPCQHPIIIINGMKFEDINAILNFMYKGEVNVSHEGLSSFLQAAEALKVKGLVEAYSGERGTNSVSQEVRQSDVNHPKSTDTPPRKTPGSRKRSLSDSNRSDDEGLSGKRKEPSPEVHEFSGDESFMDDSSSNVTPSNSVPRMFQNSSSHQTSSNKRKEDEYDVALNRMFEQTDSNVSMNKANIHNLRTERITGNATEIESSNMSDPDSPPDIKPIINFEESGNLILCSEQSQPGPSRVQDRPLSQFGSSHAQDFQETILKKLAKLEDSIKKISQNVSLIGANINSATAVPVALYDSVQHHLPALPVALPMTTYEELQAIEDWLHDPENIRILATQLSSVGGSDARDTTRRILSRVLKGEITWSINWTGKNGKIGFMKTALASVIISAVQISHPDTTEKSIEENVKMWFRFAKDRDGGREKRRLEKSTTD